jgi:hypothetical protein
MRILELKEVVSLLRAEVRCQCMVQKDRVHRSIVSNVLNNLRPPTKSIIKALKLRTVFVVSEDWPKRPTRSR